MNQASFAAASERAEYWIHFVYMIAQHAERGSVDPAYRLLDSLVGSFLGLVCRARAVTIVVPNANTSVEGEQNNSSPFDTYEFRYQQVYDGTEFPSSPILITEIRFRPDSVFGIPFSRTVEQVQIDLSTTSASPDELSSMFADNVGADDVVVHNGPLTLSSAFIGPASGPKEFDIAISISPFLYDRKLGNLLLDVRKPEGTGLPPLDSTSSIFSDAVSRVDSLSDANSPVATNTDSVGLITQFTYIIIPEPAAWLLLMCGLAATAMRRH
jgi:hypothetical protein